MPLELRAIRRRDAASSQFSHTMHPVVARVLAARGVVSDDQADLSLNKLLPPDDLLGIEAAADIVVDHIVDQHRILIVGDYDADGATSCALAVGMLRAFGAEHVDFLVPDRFRMGYGLSPELSDIAASKKTDLLITVDNGIASVAGVARAKELGIKVIITDHHLSPEDLPRADAIVNPNQREDGFKSKALAGVGVIFYLMMVVRQKLRTREWFSAALPEPNLADWLDLVALGTVADVVPLDYNNRILVENGLQRIRAGRVRPGIKALLAIAKRDALTLSAADLGFAIGPRLNAAGRLDHMRLGIECLLADTADLAFKAGEQLDELNQTRKEIQQEMSMDADIELPGSIGAGVCFFQPHWHEGVVGLVASRMKEKLNRPIFAFAPSEDGNTLKGSGRSIPGVHIRDALVEINAHNPGLIEKFGGHAMAAGLSIGTDKFEQFSSCFMAWCESNIARSLLESVVETDGPLSTAEINLDTARALENCGPWGQAFPEPVFEIQASVSGYRKLNGPHIRYDLTLADDQRLAAIHFSGEEGLVEQGAVSVVGKLSINRWKGREDLQLVIEQIQPAV